MKIKVTNRSEKTRTNYYKIIVDGYYGDGDEYFHYEEVYPDTEVDKFTNQATIFHRLDNNSDPYLETLSDMEDWLVEEGIDFSDLDIPNDAGGMLPTIDDIKMYWYDPAGDKYNVEYVVPVKEYDRLDTINEFVTAMSNGSRIEITERDQENWQVWNYDVTNITIADMNNLFNNFQFRSVNEV